MRTRFVEKGAKVDGRALNPRMLDSTLAIASRDEILQWKKGKRDQVLSRRRVESPSMGGGIYRVS